MISLLRVLAITAGLGAIAAVTYGTVEATGGFGTHYAAIYVALGVIQAVLAMALGAGLVRGLGLITLAIAILAMCETANFLATVDLQLLAAEDAAAPLLDADAKHKAAVARVAAAEKSDAVRRAEAALAKTRAEAMTTSAAKSCNVVCKETLAASVQSATLAVADAKRDVQHEIDAARAALDNAPVAPSATPLADRTGWQAWIIDLVKVGFRGFAVAIGAAVLLAAGSVRTGERSEPARASVELASVELASKVVQITAKRTLLGPTRLTVPVKLGDVDAFLLERVSREEGARVSWADAFLSYRRWCDGSGCSPVDAQAFGARLDALRDELGLKVRTKGQDVFFVDLKLAS